MTIKKTIPLEQTGRSPTDPVHHINGCWYFYDETWGNSYGPFHNEEEARKELKKYCIESLGEK
jgi:hypothetical protein